MVFGAESEKGIVMEKGRLKVAIIGKNGVTLDDVLVHNATENDPTLHMALINMALPEFPVALGVVRSVAAPAYEAEMKAQIERVQEKRKINCVDDLLHSGNTWEITGNGNGQSKKCPEKI